MRHIPVFLLLLAALNAQASEIDNAAAAMAGTEAAFTQRFTPKGFTNSQVESGSLGRRSNPRFASFSSSS